MSFEYLQSVLWLSLDDRIFCFETFVLFNIHHVLSDLLLCESMQAFLLMVPIALPAMLPPGSIIRPSVLTAFTLSFFIDTDIPPKKTDPL